MTNITIVTHNACKFLNITLLLSSSEKKKKIIFYYIIYNIPYSGDGTLCKDLKV